VKTRALVTGGAGYIGAHLVRHLNEQGHFVRVLDDLSSGIANRVEDICDELIVGTLLNMDDVLNATMDVDVVYHVAAYKSVEDSVYQPLDFFMTNVSGTLNLLSAMVHNHVNAIVFSSSSAVYGNPTEHLILRETDSASPISPYGITKLIGEMCIENIAIANNISSANLRYFNVVGSNYVDVFDESSFNVFPKIISSIISGSTFKIRGIDYPTPDGTCVRDYIHVADVVDATYMAGEMISKSNVHLTLNIGSGRGFSIFEILESFKKISNFSFAFETSNRRLGDPHTVIADISTTMSILKWTPERNLDSIIKSILGSSIVKSAMKSGV
jgi:UDP-glucose 4-epimerase